MKNLNNLFFKQLLLFFLLFSLGYGITVSSTINSTSQKFQIGNRANHFAYSVVPTYMYRTIREDVTGVRWYNQQRMWSHVNNNPSGGWNGDTTYITYRMTDNKGGQYELVNGSYSGKNSGGRVTMTSSTTWEINTQNLNGSNQEVYANFDVNYTLPNTDDVEDGLITVTTFMDTLIEPPYGTDNNHGTTTINKTYKFATYTTLNVNDIDFGTIVPNSSKNYEKTSTIAIGGGKNTTVNIGVNAGSGTVFGQKTVGKLVRAGGTEYIPVEFSIVDSNGNITSTARINDNWGGEAYLKGFIPSYTLTPKLPRGRYNGTVTVEVTTQ